MAVESFPSSMRRAFRLKSRVDFQAVYAKGRSVANKAVVVYVLPQKSPGASRVGFAAGKKLGKAAVRNRVKRRIRAVVGALWTRVKPGYLLVFIARQAALDIEFGQLRTGITELLERAGVLRREGQAP